MTDNATCCRGRPAGASRATRTCGVSSRSAGGKGIRSTAVDAALAGEYGVFPASKRQQQCDEQQG
jgi:hypothetical protein